jgi:hypothetical protein
LGEGQASEFIGQDSGDVFALLMVGYNFDGTQNPVVRRQGDPVTDTPILSVPNFYGAHGYDPTLPNLSTICFAAGTDVHHGRLTHIHNIAVARILGVKLSPLVQGTALPVRIPRQVRAALTDNLSSLLPSGNWKDDHRIDKALRSIIESFDDRIWLGRYAPESHRSQGLQRG